MIDVDDIEFPSLVSEFVRKVHEKENAALAPLIDEMRADETKPGIMVRARYVSSASTDTVIVETSFGFDASVPNGTIHYAPIEGSSFGAPK